MVEDCSHLLDGDSGEPLHELRDLHAIFEVLNESPDGDACASKHPCTADALWIALDCRLIKHARVSRRPRLS
jgi:hypothetical protein